MKNTTDVEGQDSGISLTLNISSTNEKSFDDTHLAAAKRLKASGLYPDRYLSLIHI